MHYHFQSLQKSYLIVSGGKKDRKDFCRSVIFIKFKLEKFQLNF